MTIEPIDPTVALFDEIMNDVMSDFIFAEPLALPKLTLVDVLALPYFVSLIVSQLSPDAPFLLDKDDAKLDAVQAEACARLIAQRLHQKGLSHAASNVSVLPHTDDALNLDAVQLLISCANIGAVVVGERIAKKKVVFDHVDAALIAAARQR